MPRPRRTADLRAEGIGQGALRGPGYRAAYRGVHVPADLERTPLNRILAAAALLPAGGAVGGWAAAYLTGVTELDGLDEFGQEIDVLLCVPAECRLARRPGIRWLRAPVPEVQFVAGTPVTLTARTAVDTLRTSVDVRWATVALDAFRARDLVTPDQVREELESRPGQWGSSLVRGALQWSAAGVRSPRETLLRLIHRIDAGLPEPLVNPRVTDLDGAHLGRPDLLDVEAGTASEFDGRGHRELAVATVDNVRQEGMERHGLLFARFTNVDLWTRNRARTVWRMQDLRRRGMARKGQPRLWIAVPD